MKRLSLLLIYLNIFVALFAESLSGRVYGRYTTDKVSGNPKTETYYFFSDAQGICDISVHDAENDTQYVDLVYFTYKVVDDEVYIYRSRGGRLVVSIDVRDDIDVLREALLIDDIYYIRIDDMMTPGKSYIYALEDDDVIQLFKVQFYSDDQGSFLSKGYYPDGTSEFHITEFTYQIKGDKMYFRDQEGYESVMGLNDDGKLIIYDGNNKPYLTLVNDIGRITVSPYVDLVK